MKILMICPYFYPNSGGMENYAYNIAKGLVKKEHSITVLCATKEGQDKTETLDGIKIIRQKPDFIISNTPIKLNLYFTISKLLKNEKFDLVNAHTPVPFYADMANYASKKCRVPFVLTVHGLLKTKGLLGLLSLFYQTIFEKKRYNTSKKIIAASEYIAEYLKNKDISNKMLFTIPPSVNSSIFLRNPNILREMQNILFVGQLNKAHKFKGLNDLIEAIYILKNEGVNVKLNVVGNGNQIDNYRTIVHTMQIKDIVTFHEDVDYNCISKYYNKASILVMPTYLNIESFGMVLIEAMACGTPVIGTKIGGIPFVIKNGKTGLLVEPKNPKSLAEAIKRLLEDKELWDKLSKNGIKEVKQKYEYEKIIDKTENVFKEVIE